MNINNTAQAIQQQRQTPKSQALKNRKPLVSTLFSQLEHSCTLREAPGAGDQDLLQWRGKDTLQLRAAVEQENLLDLKDKGIGQTQAQDV